MTDIEQVIKHAVMAHHDNECTSVVILMVVKGEPEAHIAIAPADVFQMNGAVDMFKTEMIKLMHECTVPKEDRK